MNVYQKIIEYAEQSRIALQYKNQERSYREICDGMLRWSQYLKEKHPNDSSPIMIYGHKQLDILACMLGCSLAGHPYVPIDITFPVNRVDMVVNEIEPKIIVDFEGNLPHHCNVLTGEEFHKILYSDEIVQTNEITYPKDDEICYIIFTSGSSGNPKGVAITFGNLNTFMHDFCPIFSSNGDAYTVLNALSYSFDFTVGYLYPSLYYGCTLYTIDKKTLDYLGDFFAELKKSGVQIVMCPPSIMEMCMLSVHFTLEVLPVVQKFVFCGEVLTNELAGKLRSRFTKAEIINAYGPTEATVFVSAAIITDEMIQADRPLTIGKSFPSAFLRVVDDEGNVLGDGQRGELQIIGDAVSVGYYHQPDLTDKAFFVDGESGKRGYRTGDICYIENDLFYFCCRNDYQIKLNGYRIELGDIENNLLKIPYISRAVVIPAMENNKIAFLTAFVVLTEKSEESPIKQQAKIKKALAADTASYMVPRKIIIKDSFPMNANGKTDRKILALESNGGK